MYCPECGSKDVVDLDLDWKAQSQEPNDKGNCGTLREFVCRVCSRAFWLGVDEEGGRGTH